MVDLGTIERVSLRTVWPHEEHNFSRWLAENLDKLGEALGLDLEFREREAPVGPFSLDVLAHDRGSDRPVIIENQLEATNHTHLGQLLTYAAGYDPYAVVWLTREFQDEHRQALDWLNQRTGEDTAFFGVVVEAWKIDNSRPAPHFRLVAMPNDWQKRMASAQRDRRARASAESTARRRQFFDELDSRLLEESGLTPGGNHPRWRWQRFRPDSPWRDRIYYGASDESLNLFPGKVWVQLYINSDDKTQNEAIFDKLAEQKELIESELAGPLEWLRQDNRLASRILTVREGSLDEDNPERLRELQEWVEAQLVAFKRVFEPHLAELMA